MREWQDYRVAYAGSLNFFAQTVSELIDSGLFGQWYSTVVTIRNKHSRPGSDRRLLAEDCKRWRGWRALRTGKERHSENPRRPRGTFTQLHSGADPHVIARRRADYAIAGAAAEGGQEETSEGTRRARTHFRADSAGAHHGRGRIYTSMRHVACSQRTCARAVAFHEREPSEAIRCPGGQVSRSRARYGWQALSRCG